jgi:hypothetical protein
LFAALGVSVCGKRSNAAAKNSIARTVTAPTTNDTTRNAVFLGSPETPTEDNPDGGVCEAVVLDDDAPVGLVDEDGGGFEGGGGA